jgi:hypothetical protein
METRPSVRISCKSMIYAVLFATDVFFFVKLIFFCKQARPVKKEDGSSDLMKWKCGIPGKKGVSFRFFFRLCNRRHTGFSTADVLGRRIIQFGDRIFR